MSNDELERQLEESQDEAYRYKKQLEKAVDKLADMGAIDNNPHTKYLFRTGQKEL